MPIELTRVNIILLVTGAIALFKCRKMEMTVGILNCAIVVACCSRVLHRQTYCVLCTVGIKQFSVWLIGIISDSFLS